MSNQSEQAFIPVPKPLRDGWEQAIAEMAARGDDVLLDGAFAMEWDRTEWTW